VQLIAGGLTVNGQELHPGDGASISGETHLQFAAARDAHFLFFDLN